MPAHSPRPFAASSLDEPPSPLARRLIREGCAPKVAPSIENDGPHAITDVRRWLARQLLDSKHSDEEAFGIVAYHPAISRAREAA